jgi:hypothetical protein
MEGAWQGTSDGTGRRRNARHACKDVGWPSAAATFQEVVAVALLLQAFVLLSLLLLLLLLWGRIGDAGPDRHQDNERDE